MEYFEVEVGTNLVSARRKAPANAEEQMRWIRMLHLKRSWEETPRLILSKNKRRRNHFADHAFFEETKAEGTVIAAQSRSGTEGLDMPWFGNYSLHPVQSRTYAG